MLKIVAEIVFFENEYNPYNIDGYDPKFIRPAFNFSENQLHSGIFENNEENDKYLFNQKYTVKVSFPWIHNKNYVDELDLEPNVEFPLQAASKVIGKARLIESFWEE